MFVSDEIVIWFLFIYFFPEMWWGTSCGVSLLCCWSPNNIAGGFAAHTYQSLWFEWVRIVRMAKQTYKQRSAQRIYLTLFKYLSWIRKRNFSVGYLSRDRSGAEMYMSLVSDWDLDVAFVSAARPFLQLKMDIKPSEDSKNTSNLNQDWKQKCYRFLIYDVNNINFKDQNYSLW